MQESMEGMTKGYIDDLPRISTHVMISPLLWLSVHPLDHNVKKAPISNKRPPSFLNFFNSLTPKISLVILLAVSHAVLVMLVWRIWYWIHFIPLTDIFSLFSSLVCLILYWYCKEKFCLGHSCEWRVNSRIQGKPVFFATLIVIFKL